jgi:chemotaxis protein methyltransferase CheR
MKPNSIDLPIGVFVLLRDLIRERIGVSYDDDKRDLLASRLTDHVKELGIPSFLDYYYRLRYGPQAEADWLKLTDLLSVQETYFWREIEQIRVLVDHLLPRYMAQSSGSVRVWSAACATGEEPLSIAIALNESGLFERGKIEIWASDVSNAALTKARQGLYRERSFRAIPVALREKYFTRSENGWKVAPELHSRIHYFQANLLAPEETALVTPTPFVFCRNVFIYFPSSIIARVVNQFANLMTRPGYLFVGIAESLRRLTTSFELEEIDGAYVYVKR